VPSITKEVLDVLVQRRRDSRAAPRVDCNLPRKQGFASKLLVTDNPGSHDSASRHFPVSCFITGVGESTMQRFKSGRSARRFLNMQCRHPNTFNFQATSSLDLDCGIFEPKLRQIGKVLSQW
jgi:hypothetical protein